MTCTMFGSATAQLKALAAIRPCGIPGGSSDVEGHDSGIALLGDGDGAGRDADARLIAVGAAGGIEDSEAVGGI